MAQLCDQQLLSLMKKDIVEVESQISNQITYAVLKLNPKRLNCADVIKEANMKKVMYDKPPLLQEKVNSQLFYKRDVQAPNQPKPKLPPQPFKNPRSSKMSSSNPSS